MMKIKVVRNWKNIMVRGILATMFGLIALFTPGITLHSLIMILGVVVLASGMLNIFTAMRQDAPNMARHFWIGEGIISLVLGIALLFNPEMFVTIIIFLIGLTLIFLGAIQLINAIQLKDIIEYWWIYLIGGIIALGGGLIFLANPFKSATVVMALIGFFMLFYGFTEIYMSIRIKKNGLTNYKEVV